MFAEFMTKFGMEIIAAIFTGMLGLIGMVIKRMVQRYLDTGDKKALALASVGYVEQVYKELHGPQKMRHALSRLEKLLAEHNIICSATEMETLLESAVNEMNNQAGFKIAEIEAISSDHLQNIDVPQTIPDMG